VDVFQSVDETSSRIGARASTNYTLDSQFRVIAAELGTRVPLITASSNAGSCWTPLRRGQGAGPSSP